MGMPIAVIVMMMMVVVVAVGTAFVIVVVILMLEEVRVVVERALEIEGSPVEHLAEIDARAL
jgi:hypothetical protein